MSPPHVTALCDRPMRAPKRAGHYQTHSLAPRRHHQRAATSARRVCSAKRAIGKEARCAFSIHSLAGAVNPLRTPRGHCPWYRHCLMKCVTFIKPAAPYPVRQSPKEKNATRACTIHTSRHRRRTPLLRAHDDSWLPQRHNRRTLNWHTSWKRPPGGGFQPVCRKNTKPGQHASNRTIPDQPPRRHRLGAPALNARFSLADAGNP